MRRPSDLLNRCELTYLERRPIDIARALLQHRAYVNALEARGVVVLTLAAAPDLPDSVFVEDTAVVLDECAIIARPGAESRRREAASIAEPLSAWRPIVSIESPGTLEGGDVVRIGRTLFVGDTLRTNAEGRRQLAAAVEPYGYGVRSVIPTGCLHLKSAVTFAAHETVIVNPDWIDVGLFSRWQCVPVPAEEPHGANVLVVGDIVHVAASAPGTRRKLDALGFQTAALDTSEFEKAEAALTCLSLLVE